MRKSVRRQGQSTTEWVPLRKGVAYLFRYRDIPHSANGLVAKYPRSRRWRTTRLGRRVMATAIQVREFNFPQLLALAP